MRTAFLLLLALVGAVYVGYPALIVTLAAFSPRRPRRGFEAGEAPSVALVIPAHDEAAIIEAKLRNVLAIDYPRDRLRAVVISDGSSDDTCARVRGLLAGLGREDRERVVLVERRERSGKSRALSEEVPKLDAEILVFTDANAFFRPDAIQRLVEPFTDPRVGLACGRLRYVPDAGSFMSDEELYWRYEDVIKTAEGRAGRLLVGNGSIYALRAELFRPIPGSVADDFAMPLLVAAAGHRLVYAPDAVAEERLPAEGVENFRAKARIVTRGATALRIYWREVLRSGPLRVVQYLLHKVARWLMGLVLAALFFVSLAGASHPLLATALTAQVAFYLLGVAAYLLARRGPVPGWLRLPFYFLMVNAAAFAGLLEFALGRRRVIWEKSETTRRSPDEEIALARPHEGGVPVGRPFSRRAAVLVTVALVLAGLLAAETGARLTYGMRDGLRALRGAVPPKGRLRFYEIPDPAHPGNWLLRAGVHATLRQLAEVSGYAPDSPLALRARALGVSPDEVVFQINERGYKGPPLADPAGRPRILTVGDSCAFGSLIDRYSFPRALERELARQGVSAEVVNVGVAGYYPAHVLVRIEEFAALAPDVSLICIGWNALYGERYTSTTLIDRMYLLRVARALGARQRGWATTGEDPAEELRARPPRLDPADPEIERLSRYRPPFIADLPKIGERLRAAGSRVFVLTLPSLYLSGERPTPEALEIGTLPRFTDNPYVLAAAVARYNQLLRELTDEHRFEVIDLASWNRESLWPRHAYFASASALNELGQERMGERVADRLASELARKPAPP